MNTLPQNGIQIPPAGTAKPYHTEALVSLLRLHFFIRLRWVFVFVAIGALALERSVWPESMRPRALGVTLLVLAGVNFLWMAVSRFLLTRAHDSAKDEAQRFDRSLVFANCQVAADLLLLTVVLHYSGGVENPMALFYLFHMAIGSLVLRWWQAVVQGLWAVGLYVLMVLGTWAGWAKYYPFLPTLPTPGMYEHSEYVAASIVVVICGVFGTLYFTLHISARLSKRSRQLREVNDALQRSQIAIQDLQKRRSRFMQTAAHQLKSPLAGIQTLVGLIRDGVVPPEAVEGTCQRVIKRCQNGITQVAELLTLARVQEADPRRGQTAGADVGRITRELCQRYQVQAQAKQVELTWRIPEGVRLNASVDPQDLTDCIGNLIDNAIKYTPGSGKIVVVVARCEPPSAESRAVASNPLQAKRHPPAAFIEVRVADTGMGIAPEGLVGDEGPAGAGSVFDPFRRGNQALAASIPGTGLGLSIVREVVEQVGGRIRVHSKVGKGSTFIVCFPADQTRTASHSVRDTRSSEILTEDDTLTTQ